MQASSRPRRRAEGIVVRHSSRCTSREGKRCDCHPGYQAQIYSQRDGRTIRKTFRTLADARAWRAESHSALRRGTLRARGSQWAAKGSVIDVLDAYGALWTALRRRRGERMETLGKGNRNHGLPSEITV